MSGSVGKDAHLDIGSPQHFEGFRIESAVGIERGHQFVINLAGDGRGNGHDAAAISTDLPCSARM